MVQQLQSSEVVNLQHPDSDGQPMADNTIQFRWIVVIKENLELLFSDRADVFVAGDLLWYPDQKSLVRQAPDVMVVFGRPKGDRGSYKQWQEDNIAPQVVWEILSPGNRPAEMAKKLLFYQRYGVEEYYIYDPDRIELTGLVRSVDWLDPIEEVNGWTSPRLGIRFELTSETLKIYRPDGQHFFTFLELEQRAKQAEERAQQAESRIQRLEQRLRDAGLDPDQL
ncbi:Uma2 family endonuclease [Coleofasciculus sp.]|uniref:Uma2 family endonuclease n=1 Tax=Coleofasciculus sp. TaxID=3100458 RepID=UPI003A2F0623